MLPEETIICELTSKDALERLDRFGPGMLSELELLDLIIGGASGSSASSPAKAVLEEVSELPPPGLARLDLERLSGIRGIGPNVAARIVAGVELGRRIARAPRRRKDPVTSPEDVHKLFAPILGHLDYEEFHVLLLNSQNVPICTRMVTRGILDASLIHPREVFRDAIIRGAASIILVHNHPSGNPDPSPEDRSVTRALRAAGDQLGIPVLDHIIVAGAEHVSLASQGLDAESEESEDD